MKKKILALTCALALAIGIMPQVTFADGYRTRHVLDGWIDGTNWAYDVNNERYHSFETEHYQIFWGDGPDSGNVTEAFLRNCERVFENCWDKFVVEMGMTPPTTSNAAGGDHTTQYKINVIIMNTGIDGYGDGWAFAGIDGEGYPYFMCDYRAMTDWVVPHEMGHVMHFAQGRNAWEGNNYLGPWYEAIGNWFREQYLYDEACYPENTGYRTDLSALYLRAGSLMALNGRGYYEAWPFLQYLTDNPDGLPEYGKNFVAKLLNYRPSDYNTSFYQVLDACSDKSVTVQDTIGYFASHMATMDFDRKQNYNRKIAEMYYNGWLYWQQRYTVPESYGDNENAYRVPNERAPQTYGYNIIPLSGSGEVSVTLNGLSDLSYADWRARLVVEGRDGKTRYSNLFGPGETASITVGSGEELYLTVAATPEVDKAQKFGIGGWTEDFSEARLPFENKDQFPYYFTLTNAKPLSVPKNSGRAHPNGGGFVAAGATVAETAYVGPNAQVLGWAKVSDNAVIDGNAIVGEGASVSGNAYVGGNAVVIGAASVSENARVLESAMVYGNYKVSGNATVKGQAILLGNGTATGQAVAYGDLFEDEGKTIKAGAFSGYHGVNTNYGYANQTGDNTFARDYYDGLLARYEFDGNFRDTFGYSDMYGVNPPEINSGAAVFGGKEYLVANPSVFSYDNLRLELRLKYNGGTVFDLGDVRLHSADGLPVLELGEQSITLDSPFAGGWDVVKLSFLNGEVTLDVNGNTTSVQSDVMPAGAGLNYIGKSSDGDYFTGEIDYLRVFLAEKLSSAGELPKDVAPVFEADLSAVQAPLSSLTTDNNSPWCGWQGGASAGSALQVPAGSLSVTSPVYGIDKFVLEFGPSGDSIYPDHALVDGSGNYISAHRFASDAGRIYPGRGEQSFSGSDFVTDAAGQKRLGNFMAEAVYYGSATTERGAAAYSRGDVVRIIVENTLWSNELSELFANAVNKAEANLAAINIGDPVYTVTYAVDNNGLIRPVSTSCYKGHVGGFGGLKSAGSQPDKYVSYGNLKIYADAVPRRLSAVDGGVIVTNPSSDEGMLVFAAYEGEDFAGAATADARTNSLTKFFPLPDGFSQEAKVLLLSSLKELIPLTPSVTVQQLWTSSGQNESAFHELEERSDKAVYSFDFVDNGSKDSGIILGNSSTLNTSSGNYFASGSIVLLFAGGQLYTRDANNKTPVAEYSPGQRVSVRVEADIAANTYDLYVNGDLIKSGVNFRVAAASINTLALVENGGGQMFDVYNFNCE